ncbi:CLUMA_CG000985, isoform A [Clunio marinus]|uniref:CLUMA_CG000985, isoform A n=1 Tax=Clunio marinus TaxID=568069 RepID=A0A1J1HLS0_9DIPT|nr:CLUMA_CG000985, isoform A [Clunio marinus]
MDKNKSILHSTTGKKVGPPVPPRPSSIAVQKALEKTRNQSTFLQNYRQISSPFLQGSTVIVDSSRASVEHVSHQSQKINNSSCEYKYFDCEIDESSSDFNATTQKNGNNARNCGSLSNRVVATKSDVTSRNKIIDKHSFNSKAQIKVSTVLVNASASASSSSVDNFHQQSSYAKSSMQNKNFQSADVSVKSRNDELKEKLLDEILSQSNTVETSTKQVKYNGSNLKRSSSFDVLNELFGDKTKSDKKVIFHEMLISELSEMRKESNPRLSSAKSSPDISSEGNLNVFELDEKKFNTFVSLDDSGVEDEGKMDDCSSSGVGDSWDSSKETENCIIMSLPGLPPLPKSLSGIELTQEQLQIQQHQTNQLNNYHNELQKQQQQSSQLNSFDSQRSLTSSSSSSITRKSNLTLDNQLAILRREMYGLRQLDLSLLSQLWALNESIQEFRTMLEENENLSPHSPSPSNSDLNSLASDDEEGVNEDNNNNLTINGNAPAVATNKASKKQENDFIEDMHQKLEKQIQRMRIAPPAPPNRKPAKSSQSPSRPV